MVSTERVKFFSREYTAIHVECACHCKVFKLIKCGLLFSHDELIGIQ